MSYPLATFGVETAMVGVIFRVSEKVSEICLCSVLQKHGLTCCNSAFCIRHLAHTLCIMLNCCHALACNSTDCFVIHSSQC